jgi:hypothetical protein
LKRISTFLHPIVKLIQDWSKNCHCKENVDLHLQLAATLNQLFPYIKTLLQVFYHHIGMVCQLQLGLFLQGLNACPLIKDACNSDLSICLTEPFLLMLQRRSHMFSIWKKNAHLQFVLGIM